MKKIVVFVLALFLGAGFLSAQTIISVDINYPVYEILRSAETQGLCPRLPAARPYSKTFIIKTL